MASTWRLRQQHAMKTSIPVNCPWGSALSCRVAPLSLLATHCQPSVEPPCTCSSSSPTWAPSNRTDQHAVKRSAIPVNCCGAQHIPVVRPPFTFGCILRPGFVFSPRARPGPEAAVVDDEGVGLPGRAARGRYFSAHVQINVPGPPPLCHVAHAGSRNEVIAVPGAAC
jgi:hypothetical protein